MQNLDRVEGIDFDSDQYICTSESDQQDNHAVGIGGFIPNTNDRKMLENCTRGIVR